MCQAIGLRQIYQQVIEAEQHDAAAGEQQPACCIFRPCVPGIRLRYAAQLPGGLDDDAAFSVVRLPL